MSHTHKKKILVVDDDAHIREVIQFALEKANMDVVMTDNGNKALKKLKQNNCDLIILDINMPEMDGLECCREIRKTSEIPILFLSSRDDEIDRILGLEIGGDDYVTKPFSPRELVARINAILKRIQNNPTTTNANNSSLLTQGNISLNIEQHSVVLHNTDNVNANTIIPLTATEFAILTLFMRQPKRVFNRNTIMQGAYDYAIHVSDRTIDSHIRHIRQKFFQAGCQSVIETLHGVGYKLAISH